MQFSKTLIAAIATLLSLVSAAPLTKRGVLTVSLEQSGNAALKAILTNTGTTDLTFLKLGTILDDSASVRKVAVVKNGANVAFQGALFNYYYAGLPESAFVTVKAGSTVEAPVDLESVYDLSEGGEFEIAAAGLVPIAKADSTELASDVFHFESNTLKIKVDGAKINKLRERTSLQTSSCSSSQLSSLRTALSNSASLASAAATAASSGSASKFQEYFKTTASSTRSTVAARLRGVVSQSSSTSGGGTTYYCSDVYGYCSSNVLAYTIPSQNVIANCNLYYSALPALTRSCHAQDQATTTLHEFTHAPATYSPGTQDNGYGYAAATALSTARAVLNADSYALYANAIYAGC